MIDNVLLRKILVMFTRFPWNKIRVWSLRKLGFKVGKNVYIGPGLTMSIGLRDKSMVLEIGDRVSFGPNVTLILASHPGGRGELCKKLRFPPRIIMIGSDSWLGANSVIMPDVTIGKCCVVGAGAVVTKSVPDNTIVAGVPAKIIRKID